MAEDLIRVVLADDHTVVRTGLKAVLSAARDIHVIGEASNGREAVAMAERLDPDVVVMDLTMPELDGSGAMREIKEKGLRSRVLVLTMHLEDDYLLPMMEAGAAGYLVKSVADRELVDAVRAVARGDMYVRPAAARVFARSMSKRAAAQAERDRFARLTSREQNVLKLVAQGYSGTEIGEQLSISPKTVDTYKQRIQEKLGIGHRPDYVQFALKLGLLSAT